MQQNKNIHNINVIEVFMLYLFLINVQWFIKLILPQYENYKIIT